MAMFELTGVSLNVEKSMKRIEDILTIKKFYEEDNLTLHQIADMFGTSDAQVQRILRANGVKLRHRGNQKGWMNK